ncbi:MAG: PAS domain S-box protein [Acidobacteria bacterium]|nr:PAS domain S-box protein [Acidobacteriota bacterium]
MRIGIPKIIGILAATMIGIFILWEIAEKVFLESSPEGSLGIFYLVRGTSTAAIMAALAAWLMLRYRRRYEEILRRQSDEAQRMRFFFENIVQDAGEAVISLDTRGIIRSWNRAAEAIYGYRAEEMVGQRVDRLVPPDLLQAGELEALAENVAKAGFVRDHETRRVRKDGTVIRVRITRSVLRDAEGTVIGSSAIVRDITAEKEMAARLIQTEKLVAIGQAAASIAHEVRNALAGISGAIQVLKGSTTWKELPEGIGEEMDRQVARIAHIVNDLLSYGRPRALHPRQADIHRLLDNVLTVASASPEGAGKRVLRDYEQGTLVAQVDPAWLEQAFTNVVTNAYQAMGAGGTLKVGTRRADGTIEVQFTDTGCGMPEGTLARVFEPFFTTKVRGTGLGLPIVRTIIEAHRGAVRLKSSPGRGTTVTLTLPGAAGQHA